MECTVPTSTYRRFGASRPEVPPAGPTLSWCGSLNSFVAMDPARPGTACTAGYAGTRVRVCSGIPHDRTVLIEPVKVATCASGRSGAVGVLWPLCARVSRSAGPGSSIQRRTTARRSGPPHWGSRCQVLRLATEIDLALLGVQAEALLWITVAPGGLEQAGQELGRHPQVRFTAATTGSSNLLVAAAAADLNALYTFLTVSIGTLEHITGIEVTPILTTVKRTGLVRPGSI
ncbi:Lrp/AsnC ligand binding domain-containing protein [Streptomyces sp. NPDC007095]|uniref:Lrp/AsnC ligand binding domain-containing protein n=1 Tax=Streptomyces sp. NPDC007095 TaxID=3154482 RepID=UPI0033E1A0CC